jgi:TPR repeat protein
VHADETSEAALWFRRAAEHGNVDARYNWGVCLRRGLGVARDDVAAEQQYAQAALQGHRSAQLALATLKAQRAQTESDWSAAAHWYTQAARAGEPLAMVALAELHEKGLGVERDAAAALTLYRQAVAAGHAEAAAAVRRLEA